MTETKAGLSPVVMQIPEDVLRAHVQAGVAQAIAAGDPSRFVQSFVSEVLNRKDERAYSQKTVLQTVIEKMVKDVAEEYVRAYVEALRPEIQRAIIGRLKRNTIFAAEIAAKLVEALTGNVRASVSIEVNARER